MGGWVSASYVKPSRHPTPLRSALASRSERFRKGSMVLLVCVRMMRIPLMLSKPILRIAERGVDWPKRNPALVPILVRYFLLEIQRQTALARDALPYLLDAVTAGDGYRAFGLLNSILRHGVQAYHLAWPPNPKQDTERRRWVRIALGLEPKRFKEFDRSFRNAVAHFDERMDLAICEGIRRGSVGGRADPAPGHVYPSIPRFEDQTYGVDLGVFMRQVATENDPSSIEVQLFGERFDFLKMMNRVDELYGRSEEALDSGHLLRTWCRSGGEINKAEAIEFY